MKTVTEGGAVDAAAHEPERPGEDGRVQGADDPAAGAGRRRRRRMWSVLPAVAGVVVLVAAAAAWLVLDPALLRPVAERVTSAVTGRPVSIGSLDLRREDGRTLIEVRGMRIGQATVERLSVSLGGAGPHVDGNGIRLPSGSSVERFRAALEFSLLARPVLPTVDASGVVLVVVRGEPSHPPRPPPLDRLLIMPRMLLGFGLERLTVHSGEIRYRGRELSRSARFTAVLEATDGDLDFRGGLTVAADTPPLPFTGTVRNPLAESWEIEFQLSADGVSMSGARNLIDVLEPDPAIRAALDRVSSEARFHLSARLARSRIETIGLDFTFGPREESGEADLGLEGLRFTTRAAPASDFSRWTVDGEVDWSRLPGGAGAERSPFIAHWSTGVPDSLRLSAERIAIPPLAALVRDALSAGHPLRSALERLQPTGTIDRLTASGAPETAADPGPSGTSGDSARLRLDAELSGFGATAGAARIDGIDARVELTGEAWHVRVADERLTVAAPSVWSTPRNVEARGEVRITPGADGWSAHTSDLEIDAVGISGRLAGSLAGPLGDDGTAAPRLDAEIRLDDVALTDIGDLLPDLRAARFAAWYGRAVRSGRLVGAVLKVRGDPRRIPFAAGDGDFEATGTVEDVEFAYAGGWPPVHAARAKVRAKGPVLEFRDARGTLFDTAITMDSARIGDITKPEGRVRMSLSGTGSAGDLLAFVRASPLGAPPGGGGVAAPDVRAEGPASTTVELDVPYGRAARERPLGVSGEIELGGATFRLTGRGAVLEDVRGDLSFDAESLSGGPLSGRFRGEEIESHVEFTPEAGLRLRFAGEGGRAWFTTALDGLVSLGEDETAPWLSNVHGRTAWNAEYDSRNGMAFHSDLRTAAIDFPPPFGKPMGTARELEVFLVPGEKEWKVDARYGHGLRGAFEVAETDGAWGLARGGVALGGGRPGLPAGRHVKVSGRLPELDLDSWAGAASNGPEVPGGWLSRIGRIEVETVAAHLLGRRVAIRELELSPVGALGFRIELDGEGAAGEILIPTEAASGRASVHLERLHLGESTEVAEDGGDEEMSSDAGARPDEWPSFDVRIGSLRWGRIELGTTRVTGERIEDGLAIRELSVDSPGLRLNGRGSWRLAPDGTPASRFEARMTARDLSRLLAASESGETALPSGGTIDARLDLAWPDSPVAPALERMEGEIELNATDGSLPDVPVSPAGRLIALLSLDALRRVLALDLSHVFGEGFAYDRIVARAHLGGGSAEIREFTISGPAATIEMSGTIDLAARRYDQEISIIPRVTRSGALLPIWAAAWPFLVGNFLIERASDDKPMLDRVFRLRYRLRGPWTIRESNR